MQQCRPVRVIGEGNEPQLNVPKADLHSNNVYLVGFAVYYKRLTQKGEFWRVMIPNKKIKGRNRWKVSVKIIVKEKAVYS